MKTSGIYRIQSKIKSERIYIGSSVNIQSRWYHHLADLRKNIHGNSKLQNHFNKYHVKSRKPYPEVTQDVKKKFSEARKKWWIEFNKDRQHYVFKKDIK